MDSDDDVAGAPADADAVMGGASAAMDAEELEDLHPEDEGDDGIARHPKINLSYDALVPALHPARSVHFNIGRWYRGACILSLTGAGRGQGRHVHLRHGVVARRSERSRRVRVEPRDQDIHPRVAADCAVMICVSCIANRRPDDAAQGAQEHDRGHGVRRHVAVCALVVRKGHAVALFPPM